MVLKTDLEKVIAKVKTERDFAIERLDKSYETNFKLRQQIIKLEKQIDLPKSLTKSESKI
tara:strand:- start:1033 stop:1212 length:180 start_codon:yes stop_codon:yes gene_type:complete